MNELEKKHHIKFESENLAVPEVQTTDEKDELDDVENVNIQYDNVAMPEIIIKHNNEQKPQK